MKKILPLVLLFFICNLTFSQSIGLYEQFNGRYDFTFVGNTLNPAENNTAPDCSILTESSATLALGQNDTVLKAYLYWAGSGTGDLDVKLNGQDITAQRVMPLMALSPLRAYFSAWADVTDQIIATRNGTYTLSDLDLTAEAASPTYCNNATNFGGWAIIIVYSNPALPLNQLNLYDGMAYVPNAVNIELPSLNVIDNIGAKIGFIAWEGDKNLDDNETLRINGHTLSNMPLNPPRNAFNGTNSVINSDTLYNMDLDIYGIQNYINIGDQTAEIRLTSDRDFVIINAIMTKLNSQLPDATITVENIVHTCNSRNVTVNYTVHNTNSTDVLPAGTTVGIYANGNLIATTATTRVLPIGGSESGTITISIPVGYPDDFQLLFIVDHTHRITETDETNNSTAITESLWIQNDVPQGTLTACEIAQGANLGIYNLTAYGNTIKDDATDVVTFYASAASAAVPENPIQVPDSYSSAAGMVYIRITDEHGCAGYSSIRLLLDDCLYPDAVVNAATVTQACSSRTMDLTFTIGNPDSFDILPAGTPVAIFVNNALLATVTTLADIPINGSETHTITVTIPTGAGLSFNLVIRADYGNTAQETIETNNSFTLPVSIWLPPVLPSAIPNLTACETSNNSNVGVFDFSGYLTSLKNAPSDVVTFYTSLEDAQNGITGAINNPQNYTSNGTNPQTIYVRLQDANDCYSIRSFTLTAVDCLFPDGVIHINNVAQQCDSRLLGVNYTVSNPDSFDILPAGTPIAIYVNNTLFTSVQTPRDLAINESLTATLTADIPASYGSSVTINMAIDDNGTGTGIVTEINENNNTSNIITTSFWISPLLRQPADVTACETFNGSGVGSFDFSAYIDSLKNIPSDSVTFYTSLENANDKTGGITTPAGHVAAPGSLVYVRLEDSHGCYDVKSFTLNIIDCYFPDATVTIDDVYKQCNSRVLHVHYTVKNLLGTDVLPARTPVSIYANGQFIDYTETLEDIAIGGSEQNYITITIPVGVPLIFDLTFVADDSGSGTGIVKETDETNNPFTLETELVLSPVLQQPDDITECDKGFGLATFDFTAYTESLKNYPNETVTFYTSQQMADQDLDRIYNATDFKTTENPQRIYVRLDNGTCHTTASFLLRTKKCKPTTYNYITPNGDNYNDTFVVDGLRNVFFNFKMKIFNRWGNLVWAGDHSKADWDGIATEQKVGSEDTTVPNSTYYFVLELNDPDYPDPITDWIYVTK